MTMSTVPSASPSTVASCSFARDEPRQQPRPSPGTRRTAALNVWKCWRASTVVGTSTATCLPSCDRLERGPQRDLGLAVADVAARRAGPSAGRVSMSALTSLDRAQLVGRLLVRERRLHLGLPRRVRREGVALAPPRARRTARAAPRRGPSTALRTRCLVRSQSVPPSLRRASGARAPAVARDPRSICSTGTKIRSPPANASSR